MIMSFFTTGVSGDYSKVAYDFNFNALDGTILKLSEYKDKVIEKNSKKYDSYP